MGDIDTVASNNRRGHVLCATRTILILALGTRSRPIPASFCASIPNRRPENRTTGHSRIATVRRTQHAGADTPSIMQSKTTADARCTD